MLPAPAREAAAPALRHRPSRLLLLVPLALLAIAGCDRGASHRTPRVVPPPEEARPEAARAESAAAAPVTVAAPPLAWSRAPVRSAQHLEAMYDSLGPDRWLWALKLNRVDVDHVRDRDSLVLPSRWDDTLALAPFPREIPALRDTAKFAMVSIRVQAFACYDSGRLVRWGPVSTGRRDKPTPVGLYYTNWKDRNRVSTVDEAWLLDWYVNLQNFEGVSFHKYELPGRPASHSCVRLLEEDAMWMYGWCEQWRVAPDRRTILRNGTPVVVWGEWTWGGRPPWKRLPEDPSACTLAPNEIAEALRILGARVKPDFTAIAAAEGGVDVPGPSRARADSARGPAPSARDSAGRAPAADSSAAR